MNFKVKYWKIIILVLVLLLGTNRTLAQNSATNPLETNTSDPLLPQLSGNREITDLERNNLRQELDNLNQQAQAQFQAGNVDQAFVIWYRELRLRRVLGNLEEIQALGRVGEIAWQQNRKIDGQNITKRLEIIQLEVKKNGEIPEDLLTAFATAYRQLRVPEKNLEIYQTILANARQKGDTLAEKSALESIAEFYLAWFDYPQAAATYEELLKLANPENDPLQKLFYLQQLAYIYTQGLLPENASKIKERLEENYQNNQDINQLASLKISLGSDYESLGKLEAAGEKYREAFTLALELNYLATASQALEKLGDLYAKNNQQEYALQVYQELIKVQQQSYDFYGLMNTYDKIGKIYLAQNNYTQARISFEQGLKIAQSLKYQEDYFSNQIQQTLNRE